MNKTFVHKTAIIDKTAILGDNVKIGAYTIIGKDVVINNNTIIGSNAYVEYATIGKGCRIYNSASIGTMPQDLSYNNEYSKIYIGDCTVVREFVTLNRGTKKTNKTVIGKNCYFMAAAHIAHDCLVGNNVIIANCSAVGGHVEIGDNAFISSNVGLHQFIKVGKGTIIGAGTTVTMDVIPYVLCAGYRASLIGLNFIGMRRQKISSLEINNVKYAYRILFMSKLLLTKALEKINQSESVYVQEIVNFIKVSKRGIVRPTTIKE